MSLLLGGAASALLAAAALLVPVAPRVPPAWESPDAAALRAERELPSLGLSWGRVRGWDRVGPGWVVIWQPVHGAWVVSAWVPDGPGAVRWRVDAAPWLPGVRLSRDAAEVLAGAEGGVARPRDRVGRRDWQVGGRRLIGALPAGGDLPSGAPPLRPVIEAVLAGLLLAGCVSRHLVPGVPSRGWRRAVLWVAVLLVVSLPQLPALAPGTFEAGVRPWVAELAFGTAAVLLLGALVFAAQRFPAVAGEVPMAWLPLAVATGALAGRVQPGNWLCAFAALPVALPVLAGLAILAGWLAALAADGLRELVRFSAVLRVVAMVVLALASVAFGGPWAGVGLAVVAGGAVERGWAPWLATAVVWGWVFGSVWSVALWDGAVRQALGFLLAGCVVIGGTYLWRRRTGGTPTAGATP